MAKGSRPRSKSAVVLLSGGMDSATAAAVAKHQGLDLHALTIDYGQRHAIEVRCARKLAKVLGAASHRTIQVPLSAFRGSALTDASRGVPRGRSPKRMSQEIPATYVPARNTVFLALGAALAEATGAGSVYIGANAIDYSGYPDCRPEFLRAFERALARGTKRGVEGDPIRIRAPLVRKTKAQIVRLALRHGVPLEHTWSCYLGGPLACGACDSCVLRLKGFREARVTDPLPYLARP
jgi:7-cyano-7-deazaguanine synthase